MFKKNLYLFLILVSLLFNVQTSFAHDIEHQYHDTHADSFHDCEDCTLKHQVLKYNKCSFSIISPGDENSGLFGGITPINYDVGRSLEAGAQFLMMNYQKLDNNMYNYLYVFKDTSLVEQVDKNQTCDGKIFESIKQERVNLNNSEINYLYASSK